MDESSTTNHSFCSSPLTTQPYNVKSVKKMIGNRVVGDERLKEKENLKMNHGGRSCLIYLKTKKLSN